MMYMKEKHRPGYEKLRGTILNDQVPTEMIFYPAGSEYEYVYLQIEDAGSRDDGSITVSYQREAWRRKKGKGESWKWVNHQTRYRTINSNGEITEESDWK